MFIKKSFYSSTHSIVIRLFFAIEKLCQVKETFLNLTDLELYIFQANNTYCLTLFH